MSDRHNSVSPFPNPDVIISTSELVIGVILICGSASSSQLTPLHFLFLSNR